MATAESSYKRQKLKLAVKEIFTSPALYICCAIILTLPWWLGAWTYLFLKSFLYAPSGAFAWLAIVLICIFIVGEFSYFIYAVSRMRKRAQEGIMARPKAWPFIATLVTIKFLMGPGLALNFWSTMQEDVGVKTKGKVTIVKPDDQLRFALRKIEREGIFMWLVKLEKP